MPYSALLPSLTTRRRLAPPIRTVEGSLQVKPLPQHLLAATRLPQLNPPRLVVTANHQVVRLHRHLLAVPLRLLLQLPLSLREILRVGTQHQPRMLAVPVPHPLPLLLLQLVNLQTPRAQRPVNPLQSRLRRRLQASRLLLLRRPLLRAHLPRLPPPLQLLPRLLVQLRSLLAIRS